MGSIYINIEHDYSDTNLLVANGSVNTGMTVIANGTSLGTPVLRPLLNRTFDSLGETVTGASRESREQAIAIQVDEATVSALQTKLDAIYRIAHLVTTKGGGTLSYRSDTGTTITKFRVTRMSVSAVEIQEYEAFQRARVLVTLVVDIYGLAHKYDIADDFSTATISSNGSATGGIYNIGGEDWTEPAVSSGFLSVSGGIATSGTVSGATVHTHTGTGNTYGDVQVTAKIRFNTTFNVASKVAGVILKYIDLSNYLYARLKPSGAGAYTAEIVSRIAGVETIVSTVAVSSMAADTWYWLRGRIEGNVVSVEWFTTKPTPLTTPTHTDSDTLSAAQITAFGKTIRGSVGLYYNSGGSNSLSFDDFEALPLTYRNVAFPATINLEGSWSGTVDALAAIYFTGVTDQVASMLYAWWPRVGAHNYVWNGGAEVVGTSATVAYGWVATAVAGVIGAATSIARATTATDIRTGSAYFTVVTPATTDTGASFIIYRRGGFKKGVTYTANCYVKSSGGSVTAVRAKLGISGNLATGTASALTASYAIRTSGAWTPTADTDFAYFAIGVNAATATTFQVDDVVVFEGTTAPTYETGGFGPGFIPAAAYNSAAASTRGTEYTQTTDANYLVGTGPKGSSAITVNTGELEFPILPHLFTPDDFTMDEIDVSVYARVEVAYTQTSLNCVISMASERGENYGARRYGTLGSSGKTIKLPSASTYFRPVYLGDITLRVDKSKPRREWLRLAFSNSGAATGTFGIDYLVVVPTRSCVRSMSGVTPANSPDFIASTAETTKVLGVASDGKIIGTPIGGIIDHTNNDSLTPDDGLGGEPIMLHPDGAELLVWPSNMVIDHVDSDTASMLENFNGTVHVAVQPLVHLLKQA